MNPEISAIIVEDLKTFHSVIESLLNEVAPNVKVIGKSTTLTEAEHLIVRLTPSLVFLDIQFEAEGKTAFDMLKKLSAQNKITFQIIFISAFNQDKYYDEAFDYGALHFLAKPIDKSKLKKAIDRVKTNINNPEIENWASQFSQLHSQLHTGRVTKIAIESALYTNLVEINDIVYLEASGHYTYFYMRTTGTKPVCSSINIGEYERKLAGQPQFFRIHRNLIINIDYVERFSKKEYAIFLIPPFEKLQASKDRFKDFIHLLDSQTGKI